MAKKLLCMVALLLAVVFLLASCDNSDNSPSTPENPTHTHAYGEWEIQKAATCTAEGSKDRYCSCGEKQTASISATGHSYGGWTTVKEASTTETGLKERTCSCGEKETQVIEKITVLKTVSSNEWKSAFNNFGRGDFSEIVIDIDERVTEVLDNEVYGFDITVTADFQTGKFYMSGIYFWNDEIDEIDDDSESFEEGGTSFGEFVCTDWMREFWYEIEDLSDVGYSRFTYDSASASYHQRMEIDDVLCDVNIHFENGRVTKISIANATSGDVSLNSTYTYTYN
jgi:hypothetical protein